MTVEQAYRSVNWTTVILVGAMIPLSTAMTQSGAAAQLADGVVRAVGGAGPYALLAGFFLLTAILGQLISNMATAIIVIPIAVAAALDMGISPRPMLMAVNVAAAGALLTPVATPVNLMVMGPGGYTLHGLREARAADHGLVLPRRRVLRAALLALLRALGAAPA